MYVRFNSIKGFHSKSSRGSYTVHADILHTSVRGADLFEVNKKSTLFNSRSLHYNVLSIHYCFSVLTLRRNKVLNVIYCYRKKKKKSITASLLLLRQCSECTSLRLNFINKNISLVHFIVSILVFLSSLVMYSDLL